MLLVLCKIRCRMRFGIRKIAHSKHLNAFIRGHFHVISNFVQTIDQFLQPFSGATRFDRTNQIPGDPVFDMYDQNEW